MRRSLLKGAAGVAGLAGSGTLLSAPYVHAADPKVLRYLGTAVNEGDEISKKCLADTGIKIEYITATTDDVTKRVITQPNSFDVLDTEYFSLKKLVPSGNIFPLDARKIKEFDNITPVFTKGELPNGKKIGGQGTAPWKVLYLEGANSKTFSATPTEYVTLIPTVYNADTLGIRPDLIKRPISSWAELLIPEFKGKASILNIPSIGIMDAALVVEATGQYKYADKGNMTKEEIDFTCNKLIELKKQGQFRATWTTFDQSVQLMAAGEVVIQSMWSPAVAAVRVKEIPCVYAPVNVKNGKEGYRGWCNGMGLMKHLTGKKLDAAYEYLNWYLSGWQGGFVARYGYYSPVPSTAKKFLSAAEWDFWYEGKPAPEVVNDPYGVPMEKAGTKRDGGSFLDRVTNISCWNTLMDEAAYMNKRWNDFKVA
ncbi:MAG: extracellular solute-binding protein [Bradyrhizobium sp.]|nr:extracellular solute-binding protein [Bradyrhizobium sp.]